MNEDIKIPEQHVYDKWKAITESDFVTLFIKTWFAFVATLRELYPDKAKPYYQAAGDSPYLSAYKADFSDKFYFLCTYSRIDSNVRMVYREGIRLACGKYPRYLIQDFFNINLAFKEHYEELFASPGGYNGTLRLQIKNKSNEIARIELICTDKQFQAKANCETVVLTVEEDYGEVINKLVKHLEDTKEVLSDAEIIKLFYIVFYTNISTNLNIKLEEQKETFPLKGNVYLRGVFSALQSFCTRAKDSFLESCLDPSVSGEHKLLSQVPKADFSTSDVALNSTEEKRSFLWFISYAYRLRNALFHEIIDPLNNEWQSIFKNAYMALKQIVDANILRLQWIDLFSDYASLFFSNEFSKEPPFGISSDEYPMRASLKVTKTQLERFDETGAKVHIWANFKYDDYKYVVEGDVRWSADLHTKSIKHVTFKQVDDFSDVTDLKSDDKI